VDPTHAYHKDSKTRIILEFELFLLLLLLLLAAVAAAAATLGCCRRHLNSRHLFSSSFHSQVR
jgi:hypothetical protein